LAAFGRSTLYNPTIGTRSFTVEIRPQLMPRKSPIGNPFDIEHSFSRDLTPSLPSVNGLRGHAK